MKKITRSIQQLIKVSRNNHDDDDASSVLQQGQQESKQRNGSGEGLLVLDPKRLRRPRRLRGVVAKEEAGEETDDCSCSCASTTLRITTGDLDSSLHTLDFSISSCEDHHNQDSRGPPSSGSSYPTQVVYRRDRSSSSSSSVTRSRPRRHLRPQQHQRHSVSFDESRNRIHDADVLGGSENFFVVGNGGQEDELANNQSCRWYTEEECHRMKEENQFTFQTVCRMVRTAGGNSAPNQNDTSYAGVLARVYRACCDAEQHAPQQLVALHSESPLLQELGQQCQLWIPRTGLEHKLLSVVLSSSSSHYQRNYNETPRARQMILIRRFAVARQQQEVCDTTTTAMATETLREECEQISRPSRLFAQVLAQAQQPQR
ncbi:hypothetical protein ACA910_003948 [Epithemia clementina (nom. ined.)]